MMAATEQTALLPFSDGGNIPPRLRANNRWAPWRAAWDTKRGKYDKIPVRADHPELGLSTANPARWFSFEAAVRTHQRSGGMTAGVGYCMTKPHGIVGVDLDGAVVDGVIEPWAQEIVERIGGYTETSPSGRGLRVFVAGEIESDWTNHEVGVEIYAGWTPRFLTLTGRRWPNLPTDVGPAKPGALEWLTETYRMSSEQKIAKGELPPMPLMLHPEDLPELDDLGLPPRAVDFLNSGETTGDRSRTLHSTSVALFSAGLNEVEVLSILFNNPFALEVALDHRRQDHDKALDYLWHHHVCAAKPKAASRVLTADDFEAYEASFVDEDQEDEAPTGSVLDDFDVEEGADEPPTRPKLKFAPLQAAAYAALSTRLEWLVPNVLPAKGLSSCYGESGAGKTFFVIDMFVRVAAGLPWWGRGLQSKRVVYVAAEGAVGVRLRLQAIAKDLGLDLSTIPLYVLAGQPNIMEATDVKALVQGIRSIGGADVVVLDTIAQVTPGSNENSSEDMGKALKHCQTLQSVLDCAVVLVGHSGKDTNRGQRGWSGIKGAMDAQIEVTRTATYRAATVSKLKDGTGEGVEYMFQLKEVLLDVCPVDGDTTSCVVEPVMNAEQKAAHVEATAKSARGRPPKYKAFLVNAAQDYCGATNKPIGEQRLIDAAVAGFIDQHGEAPERIKQSMEKALKAMLKEAQPDLLKNDRDEYTLKVPPAPVSFED